MNDKKQPSGLIVLGGVVALSAGALALYYNLKRVLFGGVKLFKPYVNMNTRDYLYYHKLDFIMVKWVKALLAENRVIARRKAIAFCGESCLDTRKNNSDMYDAAKNVVYAAQSKDLIEKYLKGRIDSKKREYFISKYGAMLAYMKNTYATTDESKSYVAPVLQYIQDCMIDHETKSSRDSEVWFDEED